jgi:hypothetical protein
VPNTQRVSGSKAEKSTKRVAGAYGDVAGTPASIAGDPWGSTWGNTWGRTWRLFTAAVPAQTGGTTRTKRVIDSVTEITTKRVAL